MRAQPPAPTETVLAPTLAPSTPACESEGFHRHLSEPHAGRKLFTIPVMASRMTSSDSGRVMSSQTIRCLYWPNGRHGASIERSHRGSSARAARRRIEGRVPRRLGNELFYPDMVLRDLMDLGHQEKAVPRDVSHPNMFPGLSGASVAVAVSR